MPTALPIIEQIAGRIEQALLSIRQGDDPGAVAGVQAAAGPYRIHVDQVVRASRREQISPLDATCYLRFSGYEAATPTAGDADPTGRMGLTLNRVGSWEIDYQVEPPDADPTAIEQLRHIAIAEIERGIAEAFEHDPLPGYLWELRPPEHLTSPDDTLSGVRINIAVRYRHTERNPYSSPGA
jgi:hypothetical protein